MKNIIVLYENGTTGDFTLYPCKEELLQKISGKIFKDQKTLECLLMAASKGHESYIRGLGCPKDAKVAFETIENAKSFKYIHSAFIKDTREEVKESLKRCKEIGRIFVVETMEQRKTSSGMKWIAEGFEIIK